MEPKDSKSVEPAALTAMMKNVCAYVETLTNEKMQSHLEDSGVKEAIEMGLFAKKVEDIVEGQPVRYADYCPRCSFKVFAGISAGLVNYASDAKKRQRARLWLHISAQLNNPFAQYLLGVYHYHLCLYNDAFITLLSLDTGPLERIPDFDTRSYSSLAERDAAKEEQSEKMRSHLEHANTWLKRSATLGFIPAVLYLTSLSLRMTARKGDNIISALEKWLNCAEHLEVHATSQGYVKKKDADKHPVVLYYKGVLQMLKGDRAKAQELFFMSSRHECAPALFELYRMACEDLSRITNRCTNSTLKSQVEKTQTIVCERWLKESTSRGYHRALQETAYCLEGGLMGFRKDLVLAGKFYERAALKGNTAAMSIYGAYLEEGRYVSKDFQSAFNYYLLSAKGGSNLGRSQTGLSYKRGFVVNKDLALAMWWLGEAVKEGFGMACYEIGVLCKDELKNWKLAHEYFERASKEFGLPTAFFTLGEMFMRGGPDFPQDVKKARALWTEAQQKGCAISPLEWKQLSRFEKVSSSTAAKPSIDSNTTKTVADKKKSNKHGRKKKGNVKAAVTQQNPLYMAPFRLFGDDGHDVSMSDFESADYVSKDICYLCGHVRQNYEKPFEKLHVCAKCVSLKDEVSIGEVAVCTEIMDDTNSLVKKDAYIVVSKLKNNTTYFPPWIYGWIDTIGNIALMNSEIFTNMKKGDDVCFIKLGGQQKAYRAVPAFLDILAKETVFSRFSLRMRLRILRDVFMKHTNFSSINFDESTIIFNELGAISIRSFGLPKYLNPLKDLSEAMDLIFPERKNEDLFMHLKIQLKKGVSSHVLGITHPFFCDSDESLLNYLNKISSCLSKSASVVEEKHATMPWLNWVLDDWVLQNLKKKVQLKDAFEHYRHGSFDDAVSTIDSVLMNGGVTDEKERQFLMLAKSASKASLSSRCDSNVWQEINRTAGLLAELSTDTNERRDLLNIVKATEKNESVADMLNFCASLDVEDAKEKVKKILKWAPSAWMLLYEYHPLVLLNEKERTASIKQNNSSVL